MKNIVSILLFMLIVPTIAQEQVELTQNLTDGCVSDYDESVDYFPEKATFLDATNISVVYHNHYKVVTVLDAFDGAEPFNYVLVQCGTPMPSADNFAENTQFIEVPTGDIITLSTTQLPHLTQLGLLDNLVAMDSFDYVNTPAVREKIDGGDLDAVGFGSGINVELVLNIEPDVVMASGFDPDTDAHPVLLEAGIFTALNASWREVTPLGRAEWIKYVALFYNVEAQATEIYDDIVLSYNEAKLLAAEIPEEARPTVLWNRFWSPREAWTIPGAQTYAGTLIQDAGGRIALTELAPDDSVNISFEVAYEGGLDADIWSLDAFGIDSLDALYAEDSRYADFGAVASGNVWNNNLDVNENGGNNYYELGVTRPDLVLRDLVAIFHPELLPDHEFVFYRRLQ